MSTLEPVFADVAQIFTQLQSIGALCGNRWSIGVVLMMHMICLLASFDSGPAGARGREQSFRASHPRV